VHIITSFFYEWGGANLAIFHTLNGITNTTYVDGMVFITAFGKDALFPLYLLVVGGVAYYGARQKAGQPLDYKRYRNQWIQTIGTLVIAYGVNLAWVHFTKKMFHMPRPFAVLPEGSVHILKALRHQEDPLLGFPSGHAAFAMTLVVSLWPQLNRSWKIVGVFFVLWIGISRIALGVHFPADVFWGGLMAFLFVCLIKGLVKQILLKIDPDWPIL
jgi:membrane-associated phospholipid phosphatase